MGVRFFTYIQLPNGRVVSEVKLGVSPTFTTNVTLRLYFYRNIHKLNL